MAARILSPKNLHQAFGRMTASFSIGQMVGPTLAGFLSEHSGSFRLASLIAAVALMIAAALAVWTSRATANDRSAYRTANGD
jgi:predicted MFS family arabinose efflux permease